MGYECCYDFDDLTICDLAKTGFRLPSEKEWKYAARGGRDGQLYPWGNTIDNSYVNVDNTGDPYEAGAT